MATEIEPVRLSPQRMLETGFVWWLNKHTLHPLGLSLGVEVDREGASHVLLAIASDGVWEFKGLEELEEQRREAWEAFYAECRAKMVDRPTSHERDRLRTMYPD